MRDGIIGAKGKAWTGEFFSVKYFLVRALVIVALFLLAQLAGLREYTTFLSGTSANQAVSFEMSAFYGMTYIALYLGAVVLAPIFLIAACLLQSYRWMTAADIAKQP